MSECKTIAICNQKGGVGKTTTAVNLGAGLVRSGRRVLLVDCDPQGDLTQSLGYQADELDRSLGSLMYLATQDSMPSVKDTILHHEEGMDVLPSNLDLSSMESQLVNAMSREKLLSLLLRDVKKDYDYISKELAKQLSDIRAQYLLLPEKLYENVSNLSKKDFNITVFGRTMAGKSTLMEALTHGKGDSIGNGAQRFTRDVRDYKDGSAGNGAIDHEMMVEVKMDNQKGMNIAVWTEKSEQLLNKTKDLFNQISLDSDVLPASVYEHEKPITIVFVGQFSAGKSTIIKALTGIEDIEIGAGIKTQETQFYKWKDLELVDTPGIGTELRPDHDEITYDAIAKADMLVYVVTSELFEDVTGQNFRKILLENDKAGEMILIVNKMATTGNTDEKRRIKLKDLEKVTEPYSPEQLRTVFIDAKSYIESKTIDDPDISEVYRERSNYDELVETINKFVKEKGYSSRLTTVLYTLFKVLQDAVEKYQPSTGDTDIDAIEEHSLHERNIVAQTMWRIESSVKSIYEASASEIREKGRNVANEIYECTDEEEANNLIEVAYNAVDEIADKCVDDVTAKIEELADDCQAKLDDFYQSDFSQTLQFRLNGKKEKNNPIINKFLSSDLIAQGSNKLIDATAGSDAAANGLKAFSGSNAHEMVLNIGHYFGHSFKPWEAVKWVKKINVAGKALGVFGVVLSLGMQAKSDIDEEKRNAEMRRNREQLRAGFNDAANELRTHFNTALNGLINENYQTRLDEIDNHVAEIRALRIDKSETYKKLAQIQDECRLLIADIHKDSEDNSENSSNKESKN